MARISPDHARDAAGMKYVYAVVSRRSGGLSIGINLNPNRACNWRCIYCQVPGLVRGKAPPIDLEQLQAELWRILEDVERGELFGSEVDLASRQLRDIALSGDGESTTSRQLPEIIEIIAEARRAFELSAEVKLVLITNGSMIEQPWVQESLRRMSELHGEVWFKLDRATEEGVRAVNSVSMHPEDHAARLELAAGLCPTWVQSCWFELDAEPPSETEVSRYVELLGRLAKAEVPIRGVLLYGLARVSHQPEAERLSRIQPEWLERLADRLRGLGLLVRVTP